MPDFDVAYLDVLIGLAAAFFVLSLIPTAFTEFAAFATRIRSKFLWAYLNQIFTKKQQQQGSDAKAPTAAAAAGLAVTPATAALAPGASNTGKPAAAAFPSTGWGLARLMFSFPFFKAGRDPRPTTGKDTSNDAPIVDVLHRQLQPVGAGWRNHKTSVKYIPPSTFAEALYEVVSRSDPATPDRVSRGIDALQGSPIYPTLSTLWSTAEGRMQDFRQSVEQWFDAEMARLSGLYKRLTRWLLAFAAIAVALIVNVDPIALGMDLWRDPGRRAQFVEIAESLSSSRGQGEDASELDQLVASCRNETSADSEDPDPEAAAERVGAVRNCVTGALDQQRELALLNDSVFEWNNWKQTWGWSDWVRPFKLAIVAVAIFLGAPFWFDVLRRLTGVRRYLVRRET